MNHLISKNGLINLLWHTKREVLKVNSLSILLFLYTLRDSNPGPTD